MRWKIRGVHAPTGEWRRAIVDAATKQEAEAIALAGGLTPVEVTGERSKWLKVFTPLFLVLMFGIGLLQAYYHGNRNSPRDMGAIVGAHIFAAAILLAVSALFRSKVGKLSTVVGVPVLAIALSLVAWKTPTPKAANARDVLNDLADMAKTQPGAPLPPLREGTKASKYAGFVELTRTMSEKTAADTAAYQKNVMAEHPERILAPANLVDANQRAASRATIRRLDKLRMDHEKAVIGTMEDFKRATAALDMDAQSRAKILEGMGMAHDKMVGFIHSQEELDWAAIEEMENILDLMERAGNAKLVEGKLIFLTQRDLDDYNRSLSRTRKLIELRRQRGVEFALQIPKLRDDEQDSVSAMLAMQRYTSWNPSPQSGAKVVLDGRGIVVNDKYISLAIEKIELIGILGQPREVTSGESVYCMWDDLGIGVMHNAGVTRITNLMIALNPRKGEQWPKQVVRGRLRMMEVDVDENSTPWSLNRKLKTGNFVSTDPAGKEWELVLDRYKLMTTFKVDGSIDYIYVSHLGRLGAKPN